MKEVEIKARTDNLDEIKEQLEKLGCKFSEKIQKDIIFFKDGIKPADGRGIPAFRIRDENGKFIFTLKIPELNDLDKIEREMEINHPEVMKEMLELINFKETIRLNKKRVKTNYNGYEICLDDVEGLGQFIEVEKMTSDDAAKTQDELKKFLFSFGINEKDIILLGYDTMLYRKTTS